MWGTTGVSRVRMNCRMSKLSLFQVQKLGVFCMCVLVTQSCLTLCNSMDYSLPGFSVHGFSRQEYWSGLPCPPPGDLPNLETEPRYATLWVDSLLSEPPGKTQYSKICLILYFLKIFLMWTIFKVITEFITKLLVFCFGFLASRHVGS